MQHPEVHVGAFVVPSEDERACNFFFFYSVSAASLFNLDFSEYPAEADKRRAFISGFNGSAGASTSGAVWCACVRLSTCVDP